MTRLEGNKENETDAGAQREWSQVQHLHPDREYRDVPMESPFSASMEFVSSGQIAIMSTKSMPFSFIDNMEDASVLQATQGSNH